MAQQEVPPPKSGFSRIVDAIRDVFADDSVKIDAFRLAVADNTQVRHVVFVPTAGDNNGVEQSNPMTDPVTGALVSILQTDVTDVECRIEAQSFDDMFDIRARILNAVHLVMHTSSEAGGFELTTQAPGAAGYTLGGIELLVQHFTWHINVPKLEADMTQPQSIVLATATTTPSLYDAPADEHTDDTAFVEPLTS